MDRDAASTPQTSSSRQLTLLGTICLSTNSNVKSTFARTVFETVAEHKAYLTVFRGDYAMIVSASPAALIHIALSVSCAMAFTCQLEERKAARKKNDVELLVKVTPASTSTRQKNKAPSSAFVRAVSRLFYGASSRMNKEKDPCPRIRPLQRPDDEFTNDSTTHRRSGRLVRFAKLSSRSLSMNFRGHRHGTWCAVLRNVWRQRVQTAL